MDGNKILYITQEISPYLPSSPLADFGRILPQSVQDLGFEVRTFMPKYGRINERRNQLHEVIRLSGMNIIIDDTDHPLIIKVATLQPSRLQVYFIDNDDYFVRHGVSDLEINLTPEDNDERCMFFARGVMETVRKLRWEPAVIHCVGWVSALAPLYLKHFYNEDPSFRTSKIVYSLTGDAFSGVLDARMQDKLRMDGFTDEDIRALGNDAVDGLALGKLAVDHADGVVVSSADANPELVAYAEASGKPVLAFSGAESFAEAYRDFYNSL